MKPKSTLRPFLALAGSSLLAVSSASAQTTYTWANSNVTGTPTANRDWFGAYKGAWIGGDPASSNLNTIQFFENTTTALPNTANPSTQTVNLNNGGTAFQLGTLTLSGRGSATTNANLTMNLTGDALNFSAATGTINLNAVTNTRTITYNVANNIQLGTTITAYKSTNGTTWTTVGSNTNTTFGSTCYIGLAIGSGSTTTLNTSQFSNVSVVP